MKRRHRSHYARPWLVWLLVLLCALPASAQSVDLRQDLARAQPQIGFTRTPAEDQPTFLPDESYRLGAGDQLQVLIWNERLNLAYDFTVNPQGEILIPRVGVIQAGGQTITALEQQILAQAMSLQRERVQVRVLLKQFRRVRVLVTGYVQRPGYYQVYWGTPLLEALRRAGGVRDNGSVRRIRLTGADARSREIDLFQFHFEGQSGANPVLSGGEQIHVPAIAARVAVLGEVQQPGVYEILPGERPDEVLRWAGGLKPTADPAGLQRWAGGLDQPGAPALEAVAPATTLQGADVLYAGTRRIELAEQAILIQGQVRQAGPQVWRRGLTLLDALEAAGGALQTADLGAVRLSRRTDPAEPSARRETTINLQAFLAGESAANPELEPDDVITVPETFFNIRNVTELTTLILSTLGIVSVVINLSRGGQ